MKMRKIGLVMLGFILIQCQKNTDAPQSADTPVWVSNRIAQYQTEPIQNPPREIWEYDATGQRLFKITSIYADGFDSLFNYDGHFVCALGGFTGEGDGKCPDLIRTKTEMNLVWSDKRKANPNLLKIHENFSGDKIGCSDFLVFRQNDNGTSILAIDSKDNHLGDSSYDIDLEKVDGVSIHIYRYDKPDLLREVYCNDVVSVHGPIETLKAISGKIHVDIYEFQSGWEKTYNVNVRGSNIIFKQGEELKVLENFRIDSLHVGWFPG